MKHIITATWILVAVIGLVMLPSSGASDERERKGTQRGEEIRKEKPMTGVPPEQQQKSIQRKIESKKKDMATVADMPVYKPPLRGAPVGRIAGGTRGILDEYPSLLCVLSPDHTGLTVQGQPSFYWFLAEMVTHPIEFTLIEAQAIEPLIEARIDSPEKPGVQCIRLATHDVCLQQGVEYKWFVAVVPDQDRRSKDILAWGAIKRVESPEVLRAELAHAAEERIPHIYAEAGLWYDAFSKISDLIDAVPNDMQLRKQRAFLLEQVKLPEIAQYEIKQAVSSSQ